MNYELKLFKKLDERYELLLAKEKEYGDTFPELYNDPDIRFWYIYNVYPLEQEILELANLVLANHGKSNVKNFREVYTNTYLLELSKKIENNNKR